LHSQNVDESKEEVEVIENTIYNQRIGRDSERYLFNELKDLFKKDDSIKVLWLNELEEKGFPYDILVKNGDEEFYYECKGTSSNLNEFQLTKNEWNFYLNNIGKYRLCFVSNIDIFTFRKSISLDKKGNKIIKVRDSIDSNGLKIRQRYHPEFYDLKPIYNGAINIALIKDKINTIKDPDIGGTPLWWSLSVLVHKIETKTILIVLSDGDANDKTNFDSEILNLIEAKKKDCIIYFIGIDQDEVATKKSKH
jgi:hypothetical protein